MGLLACTLTTLAEVFIPEYFLRRNVIRVYNSKQNISGRNCSTLSKLNKAVGSHGIYPSVVRGTWE